MSPFLLIVLTLVAAVILIVMLQSRNDSDPISQQQRQGLGGSGGWGSGAPHAAAQQQISYDDAVADARRWIERLGSQVLSLSGKDEASERALADASERYNAASSQISEAQSVRQAQLARETALEGLYYIDAARELMGYPAGPKLPPLEGQESAGKVSEQRSIEFEGRQIQASPQASAETPNYYPGGRVAGRPVPAGWYSEPWWQTALRTGAWTMGSMFLFSALFSGMSGVGYSGEEFAAGSTGDAGDAGMGDAGDMGASGDAGMDGGFDGADGFDSGDGLGGFGDFGDGFGDFGGFDGFDF